MCPKNSKFVQKVGINVSLKFNDKELADLMKNFYTLTGIRIVLFDEDYNEIFAYPKDCLPYCDCMRRSKEFYELCRRSDKTSFENCKKTGTLTMYKCHAGLIEATSPIMHNNSIIGYIMFGQVSDSKGKDEFKTTLSNLAKKYGFSDEITDALKKVKFKSKNQLVAASKILEACTSYILLKEIVKPSRIELFTSIDEYITEHLSEDISVNLLCKKFNISRTSLYELYKQYIHGGIASHIKTKRLQKAKELLLSTDLSATEIANETGFSNYNYFLMSFKKHFGVSTKAIRKGHI